MIAGKSNSHNPNETAPMTKRSGHGSRLMSRFTAGDEDIIFSPHKTTGLLVSGAN